MSLPPCSPPAVNSLLYHDLSVHERWGQVENILYRCKYLNTFFPPHPNHEVNIFLMSHTLLTSISIPVYHTIFPSRLTPSIPLSSIPLCMFIFLHLFFTVFFCRTLYLQPPLLFFSFLLLNNWCETFCLPLAGWGGLRDMTRLWKGTLCNPWHTHKRALAHMHAHPHTLKHTFYCRVHARVISVPLMLQERKCLVCVCI